MFEVRQMTIVDKATLKPEIGLRARGKDERRARLIRAARDLIAEHDDGNFIMPELAARAEVSLATAYNLIGSKGSIVLEVVRKESEGVEQHYKMSGYKPPAERIVSLADDIFANLERAPRFQRNLARCMRALIPEEQHRIALPQASGVFHLLIEDLIADGAITVAVPASEITNHLMGICSSTILRWAVLEPDLALLHSRLRMGFMLAFLGLFDGTNRAALLVKLEAIDLTSNRVRA
jgi:AcrR family transcriptional regulator